MMGDLFPETIDRAKHGAEWWRGHWQCRNFHGYFQSREDGRGSWQFAIPWFSLDDVTCTVYVIDSAGELKHRDNVPIDSQDRITVLGKKYGREFWSH